MTEELDIVRIDSPGDDEWGAIGGGINEYNQQHAGPENAKRVCFVLQDPEKKVVGGVIGLVYWDWFAIDLMYIQDPFRGQGYGTQLLKLAEDEARAMDVKHIHLDTFSFQAPDFYIKNGYEIFGTLDQFPSGHKRFYMTKNI